MSVDGESEDTMPPWGNVKRILEKNSDSLSVNVFVRGK